MPRNLLRLLMLLSVVVLPLRAAERVALIEDAPWSPGDALRDGAAELRILLALAQLQNQPSAVGLVCVGDRRGAFQEGTRRGFEYAVRQGVPVVRLARGSGTVLNAEGEDFINGGQLTPTEAVALLGTCLERYGALPAQASTTKVERTEKGARAQKLALYQAAFNAHQPTVVAMR